MSWQPFRTIGAPKNDKPDPYVASDGNHYWHGWSGAYSVLDAGHCTHAFCEEDKTGKSLCGIMIAEGSGLSIPIETVPSCYKCLKSLKKRGII